MSPEGTLLAGRYRLDAVLGDGGMGRVWQGYDVTLGRQVAVKEVHFPADVSPRDRDALSERTMREARLTAQLNHPAIVTTYDAVVEDGRPFIVMELVPAVSLAEHVNSSGPLSLSSAARIGLPLLDALSVAHAHGIVHRDVKPSNVLLADDGRVMLSDFGIATHESDPTLTTTGTLVGSPAYMSPERLRGDRRGYAADVWSLGATLYTAIEGHPPFRADTSMGAIAAIMSDDVVPPRARGPLSEAVLGMLVKDRDQRLTLEQVRPLLASEAEGEPEPERTTPLVAADILPEDEASVHEPDAEQVPDPRPETDAWYPPPPSDGEDEPIWAGRSPSEAPRPRRRPGPATLAAVLAVVVLVGLGVVGFMTLDEGGGSPDQGGGASDGPPAAAPGRGGDQRQSSEGAQPSGEVEAQPSPNPNASAGGRPPTRSAPEGFRMHQDPLGFQVAIPRGWERRLDADTRVDFVAPDDSGFVRIDQRPRALPDAEQAWLEAEPAVADSLPGYQRIRIDSVPHPTWDMADWEFTWEGDPGTVHVLNRGIATETRGFALYVSAPQGSWDTTGKPVFDVVSSTFRPTP
ncbi:MAG TPA: serine/threonine-protein kinase [Nocardioidaceae bacterium]|nr:serine/threonine-protein kinase [Nocardioidaceae bacterium]